MQKKYTVLQKVLALKFFYNKYLVLLPKTSKCGLLVTFLNTHHSYVLVSYKCWPFQTCSESQ